MFVSDYMVEEAALPKSCSRGCAAAVDRGGGSGFQTTDDRREGDRPIEDEDRVGVIGHHDKEVDRGTRFTVGEVSEIGGDDLTERRQGHRIAVHRAEEWKPRQQAHGDEVRPSARIVESGEALTLANCHTSRMPANHTQLCANIVTRL